MYGYTEKLDKYTEKVYTFHSAKGQSTVGIRQRVTALVPRKFGRWEKASSRGAVLIRTNLL